MINKLQNYKRKNLLVMIATYNEAANIELMFHKLQALSLEFDILIVDDNSPDGTGDIVERIAAKMSGIFLISRPEKRGVGSAHLDGILYAYKNDYKKLLTLDCD